MPQSRQPQPMGGNEIWNGQISHSSYNFWGSSLQSPHSSVITVISTMLPRPPPQLVHMLPLPSFFLLSSTTLLLPPSSFSYFFSTHLSLCFLGQLTALEGWRITCVFLNHPGSDLWAVCIRASCKRIPHSWELDHSSLSWSALLVIYSVETF